MAEADKTSVLVPAIDVNGRVVEFEDFVIKGRESLNAVNLVPATEHQLILIRNRRTRLIGADDSIDLRKEAGARLRAFASDRAFSFTVEEIAQVWGAGEMEVDEFLAIWEPPAGRDWVLERDAEPDVVLRAGASLVFETDGVEDIVSRPHHGSDKILVTVITTSGIFPTQGAVRAKADDRIIEMLERAARKLRITDTTDWVVQVGGNDVDPQLTYAQAGLAGEVDIEWGAREGGGGA